MRSPITRLVLTLLALAAFGAVLSQAAEHLAAQDLAAAETEAQAMAPNPALGLCFVTSAEDHAGPERLDRAVASGAAWNRFPFYWQNIETSPGQYSFSAQDRAVADDVSKGLQTLAILLGTSPVYATAASTQGLAAQDEQVVLWPSGRTRAFPEMTAHSANSAPAHLDRPVFSDGSDTPGPSKTINADNPWARYVYETVSRYKPGGALARARGWSAGQGVSHWEIWNEPDWSFFWSGSVDQYYRLLKVGYLAAKQADPNCTVMIGGLATYFNPGWFPELLQVMSADPNQGERAARNHYFDAVAIHFYSRSADSLDHTSRARALLSAHGLTKPIWVTESGVPVWDDYPGPENDPASPYRATRQEQAAYIIQSAAFAYHSGADVVFHFQLHDDCGNGPEARDAYGLYRNEPGAACYPSDAASRPALAAFRTVAAQFRGLEPLWRITPNGDHEQIAFYRAATGHRITVLWATQGHDVQASVAAASSTAALIDVAGNASTVTAQGGRYLVSLPRATNRNLPGSTEYMIGGAPYILIETAGRVTSQELVANGTFASGADGWLSMGSTPPLIATDCPKGNCLVLGSGFIPDPNPDMAGAGNSTAFQDLYLDPVVARPTLRFQYRIQSAETTAGNDWFEVIVVDRNASGDDKATYLIPVRTLYKSSSWTPASFDLSAWRGRDIRLMFNVYQSSAERPTEVRIANVSVNEWALGSTVILPLVGVGS